jgi:hypothetical protein
VIVREGRRGIEGNQRTSLDHLACRSGQMNARSRESVDVVPPKAVSRRVLSRIFAYADA